jgi:hypothetical protein
LFLTLDAGRFQSVEIDARTGAVRVALEPANAHEREARLVIEQPARVAGTGTYRPTTSLRTERGAVVIPLGTAVTTIELRPGALMR